MATNTTYFHGLKVRLIGDEKRPVWYIEDYGMIAGKYNHRITSQVDEISHDVISQQSQIASGILFRDANAGRPSGLSVETEAPCYTWTPEERERVIAKANKKSRRPYDPLNHCTFVMPCIRDEVSGSKLESRIEEKVIELPKSQEEEDIIRDTRLLLYGTPEEKKMAHRRIRKRNQDRHERERMEEKEQARLLREQREMERKMRSTVSKPVSFISESINLSRTQAEEEAKKIRMRILSTLGKYRVDNLDMDSMYDSFGEDYVITEGFSFAKIYAYDASKQYGMNDIKVELGQAYGPQILKELSGEKSCVIEHALTPKTKDLAFNVAPCHVDTFLRWLFRMICDQNASIYMPNFKEFRDHLIDIYKDVYEDTSRCFQYRATVLTKDLACAHVLVSGYRLYSGKVTFTLQFFAPEKEVIDG